MSGSKGSLHLPVPPRGAADRQGSASGAWYTIDPMVGVVHEDAHARRYFGPPMGGYGRAVDLPPFLARLLAAHITATGYRELLFANRHGGPLRHSDFLRRWRQACDGADARFGQGGKLLSAVTASVYFGLLFRTTDLSASRGMIAACWC